MKSSRVALAFLCVSVALLAASCRKAVGPVLVNASGAVAHISSRFDDGHTIEGDLEEGRVLWAGYAGAPIASVEIRVGTHVHRLEASELRTHLAGNKWAAFILEKEGRKRVRLEEMRQFTDKRLKEPIQPVSQRWGADAPQRG